MYLALRWLVGLSLAMWVAMCCIDFYLESSEENPYKDFFVNLFKSESIANIQKNESNEYNGRKSISSKHNDTALLHYAMFFAGALAVTVFNRKREIALFTRRKLIHVNICTSQFIKNNMNFKRTAIDFCVAVVEYIRKIGENFKSITENYFLKRRMLQSHKRINVELLKKVKEYTEERKSLGQLLISALRENKNLRMRYQIESTAKNRLLQYVEDTRKQFKESCSKYVSFQHLYLVTHQENIFLKARLKKVCEDKKEAEKNLLNLVNEIYQSKNSELKIYCSRFIVGTREQLLHCDVNTEIRNFLRRNSEPSVSYHSIADHFEIGTSTRGAAIVPEDIAIVPLISDAPKLKGLPGECIWTVKDKNGIIEKLYEYDYETDFDKGDTIRIRKYTVYHDKDCLLDFVSSKRTLFDVSSIDVSLQQRQYLQVDYPITTQRFLTGSQAFQKFLQENQNLVKGSHSTRPALLCE